jgi:hypothetical protein
MSRQIDVGHLFTSPRTLSSCGPIRTRELPGAARTARLARADRAAQGRRGRAEAQDRRSRWITDAESDADHMQQSCTRTELCDSPRAAMVARMGGGAACVGRRERGRLVDLMDGFRLRE